jgi:hypothetical protein
MLAVSHEPPKYDLHFMLALGSSKDNAWPEDSKEMNKIGDIFTPREREAENVRLAALALLHG